MAAYSASAVDCATVVCFFACQLMGAEEFRNSHGGADAGAGTGTSYLCDSNCDMFNLTQ